MLNELQLLGEELERDIAVLQQTSTLKASQLDETRNKMHKEILENQIIRNCLEKNMNELEISKKELGHNVKANEALQEENKKCRELISKLQLENEFFGKERELLTDKCHANDIAISNLRSQVGDLEEKLQELKVYKELYEQFQIKNQTLIEQIMSKLDILNKEQGRLDNALKEGLAFTTKLSEELNLQSLFLKESNISRVTLENEMLHLIGVLEEERSMKRKLLQSLAEKEPKENYLEDWKLSQEETSKRIRFLIEENKRLLNEVEGLKIQLDMQMDKNLQPDMQSSEG